MNGELADHGCMGCVWGRYETDRFYCPWPEGGCTRPPKARQKPSKEIKAYYTEQARELPKDPPGMKNGIKVCMGCGKLLMPGARGKHCEDCIAKSKEAKRREYNKQLRRRRAELGLCTDCGKVLPSEYQYKRCANCRARGRERYKEVSI